MNSVLCSQQSLAWMITAQATSSTIFGEIQCYLNIKNSGVLSDLLATSKAKEEWIILPPHL